MASLRSLARLPDIIIGNCVQHITYRSFSNNYARICTVNRPLYKRMYPTLFINPDGSSFTARFFEPRQVVKLPMDVSTLTDQERIKWLARRKPVKKMSYQDDVKNTFTSKRYVDLIKKQKK